MIAPKNGIAFIRCATWPRHSASTLPYPSLPGRRVQLLRAASFKARRGSPTPRYAARCCYLLQSRALAPVSVQTDPADQSVPAGRCDRHQRPYGGAEEFDQRTNASHVRLAGFGIAQRLQKQAATPCKAPKCKNVSPARARSRLAERQKRCPR